MQRAALPESAKALQAVRVAPSSQTAGRCVPSLGGDWMRNWQPAAFLAWGIAMLLLAIPPALFTKGIIRVLLVLTFVIQAILGFVQAYYRYNLRARPPEDRNFT